MMFLYSLRLFDAANSPLQRLSGEQVPPWRRVCCGAESITAHISAIAA
jgi:hypothetical protein